MLVTLEEIAVQVTTRLESLTLTGHTVNIKARFQGVTTVTPAHTAREAIGSLEAIATLPPELLDRTVSLGASVHLFGITVSGSITTSANSWVTTTRLSGRAPAVII